MQRLQRILNDQVDDDHKNHTSVVVNEAYEFLIGTISGIDMERTMQWFCNESMYHCNTVIENKLSLTAMIWMALCKVFFAWDGSNCNYPLEKIPHLITAGTLFHVFENELQQAEFYKYCLSCSDLSCVPVINQYTKAMSLQSCYRRLIEDCQLVESTNDDVKTMELYFNGILKKGPLSYAKLASKLIRISHSQCCRNLEYSEMDDNPRDRDLVLLSDNDITKLGELIKLTPDKHFDKLDRLTLSQWVLTAWMEYIDGVCGVNGLCRKYYVHHWGDWGRREPTERFADKKSSHGRRLPLLIDKGNDSWLIYARSEKAIIHCNNIYQAIANWHAVVAELYDNKDDYGRVITKPTV